MKIFATLRHCARILVCSGPVGLAYAIRLAWLNKRLQQIRIYQSREKALHVEHLQALNYELTQLIHAQQRLNVAAAQYWRACEAAPTNQQEVQ